MDRTRVLANVALGLVALASIGAIAWPSLPFNPRPDAGQRAGVILRQLEDAAAGPEVGLAVPEFEWAEPRGTVRRLSELRGRVVLLNFWATWCKPCLEEMPALDRAARADGGPVVLALGIDEDPEKVDAFFDKLALSHVEPLLDVQSRTARRYGVVSLPTSFVIGPDGIIRHVEIRALDDATIRDALAKAR
ncbi:hypothetical protein BH18CHL2_BH18CHL2_05700 [soil metagenome]